MPWRKHARFGNHYELRLRKHGQIKCIDFKSKVDADAYYHQIQVQKQQDRQSIQQELQREILFVRLLELIEQIEEETNICRGMVRRNSVWRHVKHLSSPLTPEESSYIRKIKRNAGYFQLPAQWPNSLLKTTSENAVDKMKKVFQNTNADSIPYQPTFPSPCSLGGGKGLGMGVLSLASESSEPCALSSELTAKLCAPYSEESATNSSLNIPPDSIPYQPVRRSAPATCPPKASRSWKAETPMTNPNQTPESSSSFRSSELCDLSSDLTTLTNLSTKSLTREEAEQVDDIIRVNPTAWKEFGEIFNWTRDKAVDFLDPNGVNYKCVQRGIQNLNEELAHPHESSLERIIRESIVTNHIEYERNGLKLYSLPETNEAEPIARHRMMIQDRAHSRLMKSINQLMRVRKSQLDHAITLRKNRPKFYDRDDYLRVSEDVINKREDEVIIEEALNNAARWEEESQRMEQQKEDFRAAKEKAKLIEAFVDDAEPGNTNHAIVEFLKTHDVDEEGLALLGTAQKVIKEKRGPREPEPINYPIVEFLKARELDKEGSALLAVAQHLIDKKNGSPGVSPEFKPESPGQRAVFPGPDEVDQVFAASVVSATSREAQLELRSSQGDHTSSASVVSATSREAPPHRDHSSAPKGRPKLAQSTGLGQSPPSQCGLKVRSNTSALHARNVHLTNLRMTQKRADSLATSADRTTVVHNEPMPPELFEAKIQAARMRKEAKGEEGFRLKAQG